MKKALVVSATALLAALTLAIPASASLPEPDSVRPKHNISVFHNSDFVGVFGYPVGQRLTVDVYRGPHRIATAFGLAAQTPEGGGLEINHGPAGTAAQGDCWEGCTPDILPGDKIVVTDSTGTDTVLVDDIAITKGPTDDTSTPSPYDVILEGKASYADGTPVPESTLMGEMRNDGAGFRAVPNTIERVPGTTDGWRAIYTYPYKSTKSEGLPTVEEKKRAILTGDHEIGYGHAELLPSLETQIVEFPAAAGGPALDCGNPASPHYAPKEANAVTTSDDRAVNRASGTLTLGGTAMADTTAVSVVLNDEDPATPDVSVETTGLSGNYEEKGWSVSFTREQLVSLTDGKLTATGSYSLAEGGSTTGAEMTLRKDLVAPKLKATPGPKTANGPLGVALKSDGGERIRYTTDGSLPDRFSKVYRGTPIELTRTATIRTSATDAAGNRADAAFRYVIRQPSTVSLKLSKTGVRLGRSISISGVLRPAHPDGAVTVIVKRDGKTVFETKRTLNGSSGYSLRYTPKRAGVFSVQVHFAGDENSLPDRSPLEKFRVTR